MEEKCVPLNEILVSWHGRGSNTRQGRRPAGALEPSRAPLMLECSFLALSRRRIDSLDGHFASPRLLLLLAQSISAPAFSQQPCTPTGSVIWQSPVPKWVPDWAALYRSRAPMSPLYRRFRSNNLNL